MPTPSAPAAPRKPFPIARAGAIVSVLVWTLQPSPLHRAPPPPRLPPEDAPPMWATDVQATMTPPPAGGRTASSELLTGQKPARGGTCGHEDQVVIGKGCWVEVAKKPQPPPLRCGDFYEHAGRCFLPVLEAKKTPTSLDK